MTNEEPRNEHRLVIDFGVVNALSTLAHASTERGVHAIIALTAAIWQIQNETRPKDEVPFSHVMRMVEQTLVALETRGSIPADGETINVDCTGQVQ